MNERGAAPRRRHTRPTLLRTPPGPFVPIPLRLCTLLLLTLAANFPAAAQTADPSDEDVVRVETNLVTVPVLVNDARGRRVRGLTVNDFGVRDAGRPVELKYFAAGTSRVALTFLLDASGSTRETITRQRETALALLARFGEGSRVSVMRFWERPQLAVPFTTDRERVREAFLLPVLPDRHTAIFDAALASVRNFQTLPGDRSERRIVVLISDGLDTASTTRARQAIDEANAAGVTFYVVHLPLYAPRGGVLAPRPTARGFRDLADKTGGQFFTLGDAAAALDPRATFDLAPVFQAIAEDLEGQYVLGFYADKETAHDARPHPLEVRLNSDSRRKLRVRALRSSYQLQ